MDFSVPNRLFGIEKLYLVSSGANRTIRPRIAFPLLFPQSFPFSTYLVAISYTSYSSPNWQGLFFFYSQPNQSGHFLVDSGANRRSDNSEPIRYYFVHNSQPIRSRIGCELEPDRIRTTSIYLTLCYWRTTNTSSYHGPRVFSSYANHLLVIEDQSLINHLLACCQLAIQRQINTNSPPKRL